ncbi:MAG: IS66 family transposase [Lachnospirales bacterium]
MEAERRAGALLGRLELTNNWCEFTIRSFATGRRAWLFADTPEGVHANGIMYSLVLSAQRN